MSEKSPRILFVDDHEDSRALVSAYLAHQGYQVKTADSCAEGLLRARYEEFDLFVLDYRFADGTGRELCEQIREFDPSTPIVFFSASHPDLQRAALACGAQDFVLKPDLDGLTKAVDSTLHAIA
ncbi:MAG: response regulator [Acidobacteriota bacterium]|nr:response regulator [Acidobacteriota bacterium]